MINRIAVLTFVGAFTLALGGCYESVTPTRYEAGVYKGASDPLVGKLEAGDLQGQLRDRFQLAAQDR